MQSQVKLRNHFGRLGSAEAPAQNMTSWLGCQSKREHSVYDCSLSSSYGSHKHAIVKFSVFPKVKLYHPMIIRYSWIFCTFEYNSLHLGVNYCTTEANVKINIMQLHTISRVSSFWGGSKKLIKASKYLTCIALLQICLTLWISTLARNSLTFLFFLTCTNPNLNRTNTWGKKAEPCMTPQKITTVLKATSMTCICGNVNK